MKTDLEDLITQAEAARLRGVSREAIYDLVARGKLNVVEIGGQKFVKRSAVENYRREPGGRPAGQTAANSSKKHALLLSPSTRKVRLGGRSSKSNK